MEKLSAWSAGRSTFFPPPWTSSYEKNLAGDPQRHTLVSQHPAFFHCCADAGSPGNFSGCPQTRLAATHVLPPHRFFVGRTGGSSAVGRFRSATDLLLHVQPGTSLRPVHAVLRHPAIRPRMGIGIALQTSGVRLADEALRQCAGTGCAAPVGFETHVAAHAGCRRWGHQPHSLYGSETD